MHMKLPKMKSRNSWPISVNGIQKTPRSKSAMAYWIDWKKKLVNKKTLISQRAVRTDIIILKERNKDEVAVHVNVTKSVSSSCTSFQPAAT